jgi:hypothetical protein
MTTADRGPWLQTFTGRAFYPLDPRPEDVCIADIAHALALQCRFSGHCRVPYSVAEHSCRVMREVEGHGRCDLSFAALMHDAAEAYVVDVPSPIKRHQSMTWYRETEARVMEAICERFGFSFESLGDPLIKRTDLVLLSTEARDLLGPPPMDWGPLPMPLRERIEPMSWRDAEAEFLFLFRCNTRMR